MPTTYTPQLGLSLPTQGELSGTWGDVTNTSLTSLVDYAIAGTTTLASDADVTLTAGVGVANQARAAILLFNGSRTVIRNITAPATGKIYYAINATSGGFSVVLRGVGPTAGITIPNGKAVTAVWNGADFVALDASNATGVLAIANGGTGSTTASAALAALGGIGANNTALTGIPTAPTATLGTSTTQIATTAFIANAVAAGLPAIPTQVAVVSGTSQAGAAGFHYILTNVAATTVTLPAGPASGDTVWVTWTNSLTTNVIARNAQTIMGVAEDMTLDASTNNTVQLRFVNSSWRLV